MIDAAIDAATVSGLVLGGLALIFGAVVLADRLYTAVENHCTARNICFKRRSHFASSQARTSEEDRHHSPR